MSGVVQSVSNAVSGAFQSIGDTLSKIGEKAIHDPIGTIATVAAVATGQVEFLPLISAVDTVANGGNLEQAAMAAGASYLGGQIASGVTNAMLAPATDSLASMATQDAVNMSAQGLAPEQIAQTLQDSYGLSSDVANSMANSAGAGIPAPTLATAYAGAFGSELNGVIDSTAQKILATSAGNAVGNAARTLATTGNLDNAGIAALSGAVGTAVGGGTTAFTSDTLGSTASNILGRVSGATAASLVNNTNPNMAAANTLVNNLIGTSLSSVGDQLNLKQVGSGITNYLSNTAKELVNNFASTADKIDQQQTSAQDYYTNTVTPLYGTAQSSYNNLMSANNAYTDAYKQYDSDYTKYQDLVGKYDAAKASGDVTTANDLASQINNLKDSLTSQANNLSTLQSNMTAAGDKYNTDYAAYTDSTSKYTGQIQAIKDTSSQLTSDIQNGSNSVNSYLNNVKDVTNQVDKMSTTAGYSFYNNFNQTGDANSALKIADTVNSLNDSQQATYYNAVSKGLTNDQALTFAQNYSNLGINTQNDLIQSSKTGGNDFLNQVLAATQQIVDPGSAALNVNAPNTLTNPNAVSYYNQAVASGVDPTTALKTATDYQSNIKNVAENVIGFLTGSSNAQAGELPQQGTVTVTGAPDSTPGVNQPVTAPQYTKAQLDEALNTGDITQDEYNQYMAKVGNQLPTTPTTNTQLYNDLIDKLFTGTNTTKTTTPGTGPATTGTGTSGASTGVGTGTGTGTGGGTGTGTGTGTGGGTGTGTGTGTGSGAGTGTSFTPGGVTNLTGSTGGYGGVTNLSGTLGGGKAITLVGEPTTQDTVTPMAQSYQPPLTFQPTEFASGGSTSGSYDPIGTASGGASSLTPLSATFGGGLAKKIALLGSPSINEAMNPISANQYLTNPIQALSEPTPVVHLADGGQPDPTYQYLQTGFPRLSPAFVKGRRTALTGLPSSAAIGDMSGALMGLHRAEGGDVHTPEFYSEGGLKNKYVQGAGDGTSDDVPAMLADGEFVIPADVVSSLGNGSNEAGAKVLDEFMQVIRAHKQKHNPKKLPPNSKGPLAYLKAAKSKVK